MTLEARTSIALEVKVIISLGRVHLAVSFGSQGHLPIYQRKEELLDTFFTMRQSLRPLLLSRSQFHHPVQWEAARDASSSSSTSNNGVWVQSPRDISTQLSKYVIGQSHAKRILSVAVFNHYHRITHERLRLQERERIACRERDVETRERMRLKDSEGDLGTIRNSSSAFGLMDNDQREKDRQREREKEDERLTTSTEPDPTKTHDVSTWRTPEITTGVPFFESSKPPRLLSGRHSNRPPTSPFSNTLIKRSNEFVNKATQSEWLDLSTRGSTSANTNTVENAWWNSEDVGDGKQEKGTSGTRSFGLREDVKIGEEDVEIEKSNILLLGPTGSGKSHLCRTLAKILNVPFASCDATSFTQAGYVGEDVESSVLRLLQAANYDVEQAEVGIIHIDECDKLAKRDASGSSGRDVGGEGVQQALLRLLEGTDLVLQAKPPPSAASAQLPAGYHQDSTSTTNESDPLGRGFGPSMPLMGKKGVKDGLPHTGGGGGGGVGSSKGESFNVNTSSILFILSGAFVGLDKVINRRVGKGSIGFGAPLPQKSGEESSGSVDIEARRDPLVGLTTGDLVEYGFIPEFIGRLPVLAPLHHLSLHDLVRVLIEPKNALIKQYRALFKNFQCDLAFSEGALWAIAREASVRGTSARHLRSVLEEILLDSMYEVPQSSVRYVAITASVVRKEEPAHYFSRGQKHLFVQMIDADVLKPRQTVEDASVEEIVEEVEEEQVEPRRATG